MANEIVRNMLLTVNNPSAGGGFYDQEIPPQKLITQNAVGLQSQVIGVPIATGSTVNQGTVTKPSAAAATTAALASNTYANGASGVGATLTATANAAIAAVDGVTLGLNQNVLVKNEATGANNGLYTVTQVGDGSHPYILTRVTSMDSTGKYVGAVIWVDGGTANGQTNWNCTNASAPNVGTTAITFAQSATGTVIPLGNITTNGICYVQNLDATNSVQWGQTVGGAIQVCGKLKAGEWDSFRLDPAMVPRLIATGGTVNVKVKIFQD